MNTELIFKEHTQYRFLRSGEKSSTGIQLGIISSSSFLPGTVPYLSLHIQNIL